MALVHMGGMMISRGSHIVKLLTWVEHFALAETAVSIAIIGAASSNATIT